MSLIEAVPVLRPAVPEPTATSTTVQKFVMQFLLSQDPNLTLEQAQDMAKKIKADGEALYRLPEKRWSDELGYVGETIYEALQKSKYGYDGGHWPQIRLGGSLLFSMGVFNGAWQFRTEKELRDYRIPIAFTTLTAILFIFSLLCRSSWLIQAEWFPSRFRIRSRNAPTGPWGLWS